MGERLKSALIPGTRAVTLLSMNAVVDSSESDDPIHCFVRGDRRAFDDLYGLHARELLAFLIARLRNRSEAEDVLQDVWLKVWAKRALFVEGSFRGWIFKIAHTTLVDRIRTKKRRQEVGGGRDAPVQGDAMAVVLRNEELRVFRECLKEVGGVFVDVFRMVKVENRSPEDVAATLAVTRGTVDTRVHKGKQRLKDCVENKLR